MKCFECNFHKSGYMWNGCQLTGDEYYHEFYNEPCPFIDDNYIVIADCPELGLKKGEQVGGQE